MRLNHLAHHPLLFVLTLLGFAFACGSSSSDDGSQPDGSTPNADASTEPMGVTVEELGLFFPDAERTEEPVPEPTTTGDEPVVVSATMDLENESLEIELETPAEEAEATIHLLIDTDIHIVFNVPLVAPPAGNVQNIVPGWNGRDVDNCGFEAASQVGCYAGCTQACVKPATCDAWYCADPFTGTPEECYAERASGLTQEEEGCLGTCSEVVALLDVHRRGELLDYLSARYPSSELEKLEAAYNTEIEAQFATFARASVEPAFFAATYIERSINEFYCDLDFEHDIAGNGRHPMFDELESMLNCPDERGQTYWDGRGDDTKNFMLCTEDGPLPEVEPAPKPKPRRGTRIKRPFSLSGINVTFPGMLMAVKTGGSYTVRRVGKPTTVMIRQGP